VQISENYVVARPDDIDLRGKKALRRFKNLTFEGAEASMFRKSTQIPAETGKTERKFFVGSEKSGKIEIETGQEISGGSEKNGKIGEESESGVSKVFGSNGKIGGEAENFGSPEVRRDFRVRGVSESGVLEERRVFGERRVSESGVLEERRVFGVRGDFEDHSPFKKYTQVFADRMDFVPGLSVVDLIFCEGPRAREFLRL
jgi:hypothetical protein